MILLVGFTEDEIEGIAGLGYPVLPVPEHFKELKVAEILEKWRQETSTGPAEGSS